MISVVEVRKGTDMRKGTDAQMATAANFSGTATILEFFQFDVQTIQTT